MPGNHPPRPTDAELEILSVLWSLGPSTVRGVLGALGDNPPRGYTTVLKHLQIMTAKGLVRRERVGRAHVYAPRLQEETTQRQLLDNLLEKAFRGSAGRLVMQVLSNRPTSQEELAEIRRLLDEMEGDDR